MLLSSCLKYINSIEGTYQFCMICIMSKAGIAQSGRAADL